MWIMVGVPYGTGAKSAADRAANLRYLNEAALALFRNGHVPIIGVDPNERVCHHFVRRAESSNR